MAILFAGLLLSACQGGFESGLPKETRPIPERLIKKIKAKGMTTRSPILLRIYKVENVLEVWKAKDTGRYDLLETYEICKWSGKLGPKFKEGDRQAPEGFYTVRPAQMNPKSEYHLSFNMGFPNAFDRAHGRTGSHLMVHGACSSAGCYSMTDEYVEEIYSLAREAFKGGQKAFQIQAFPFRMTPENMIKHANHPQFPFWKLLKEGHDHFEVTRVPPKIDVCEKRYVFNRIAEDDQKFSSAKECPPTVVSKRLTLAFSEKQKSDQEELDKLLSKQIANPFLPEEERPKLTQISILAEPTIGPVRVIEPQPAEPKPQEPAAATADVVRDSGQEAKKTASNSGSSVDPITQEVSGQSPAATSGNNSSVAPATIAVPKPAPRQPSS